MIKLVITEIVEAIRGQASPELRPVSVGGVSTDSRSVRPGELFFALRGPNFDGHDFVVSAVRGGAVAAVISAERADELRVRLREAGLGAEGLILVDDPLAALGRLGAYHRVQAPADVIAVAGSNGKTTTKAMIDHVLGGKLKGRCSPKSFNNAIGVPLTLLSTQSADDYLVVEIGTNAPGEVAALARLASPDLAVITCIGEEHLEKLGDLDGVAAEECSILRHVRKGGFAAVNGDAPQIRSHIPPGSLTVVTFGHSADADLRVSDIRYDDPWLNFKINQRFAYRLHMPGPHNALNAAAAIGVARRLGFEHDQIAQRLETFVPPPMRGEVLRLGGITVVNDAYNANPHSALAALSMLETVGAGRRRIVVFGEMRELGASSAEHHRRVAEQLRHERIDHVILVGRAGEYMYDSLNGGGLFAPSVERCESLQECVARLEQLLKDGDVVLLKASRAMGLDQLVEPLRARYATDPVA